MTEWVRIYGKKKKIFVKKENTVGWIHELKVVKHFWAQPTVFELRKPTSCFSVGQSLRPVTWYLTAGNCRSVSGTRWCGSPRFCLHPWGYWLNVKVGSRSFPSDGSCYLVARLCPTLCHPMDCSPPGSSVHGIFQVRILEWVAISFSRGSSWPRYWSWVSFIGRWILYCRDTWESLPSDPGNKKATRWGL